MVINISKTTTIIENITKTRASISTDNAAYTVTMDTFPFEST